MDAKRHKSGTILSIICALLLCNLSSAVIIKNERVNPTDVKYVHLGKVIHCTKSLF